MRMRTKGSGAAYGKKSDDDREAGTIALMILALCLIGSVLILGTITVTSAQLARMRLLDAADAAALDAADTVSDVVYVNGVGEAVPLTDAAVVQSASAYLSARPLPSRMQTWTIAPGTGSPDGTSAVVVLTGTAELPIIGSALDALGGSITITVSSRARADVVP